MLLLCALSVVAGTTNASGDAVSAKRREAARLSDSIDALGDKLSALAEDENAAHLRLAKLQARLQKGEADLAAADALTLKMESRAREAALAALSEPFGSAGVFVDGAGAMDELERSTVLVARSRERDRDALDALRASREDIVRKRQVVATAREETARLSATLAKRRKDADALLAKYEVLQKRANGELKTLVAQAERARAAAEAKRARQALAKKQADARRLLAARQGQNAKNSAAARAAALKKKAAAEKRLADLKAKGAKASRQEIAAAREAAAEAASEAKAANRSSAAAKEIAQLQIDAGSGADIPASPGGNSAVRVALSQLGKPYVWGATGPGSFDCSGLMAYAWRAAGRSLPHSSRAQYASTTRVSVNQIRAGDLVFFGSPIHHVGMYVGNGLMVEASRSGVPVRTRSIFRRDLVGVGRVG